MKNEDMDPKHNHSVASLSELDLEMIRHVRPGGNWQEIPESIPSKRLEQIRETSRTRGVCRTSYYGRLRPGQPAYTISTHFNRPGNGTNIHPWEHRTLSSREAARLQSFPDAFIFFGNDSAVRKQIGNAVPPLVGYAVGKAIGPRRFVDLFAGAGGLSIGLEMAGLSGVVAQELDSSAATTYRANHSSSIEVIEGDIIRSEIQERVVAAVKDKLGDERLGLLAGGPPCQGFSTAGWRNEHDSRNSLVSYFLLMVEKLRPEYVLIENVEGLVSMKKGIVMRSILEVLEELGYDTGLAPWIIYAEQFGAPQMRRRVIIVARHQGESPCSPPKPRFDKCLGRRETEKQRRNPKLRYPVTVAEAFKGIENLTPVIEGFAVNMAEVDENYSKWCQGEIDVEEFLAKRGESEVLETEQQAALL